MKLNINDPVEFAKISHGSFKKVIEALINDNQVLRATKYISPKQIIRAVRKTFRVHNRKPRKGENVEIILTIGRPNYLEKEFIKLCQKANEPFPVKMIQLKLNNSKPKKLKRKTK